jgi:hypothetical protein
MESSQIITTIATIASLCENSNKMITDYLDIITPFVIQCLPTCTETKIDLLNVKSKMQLDFGFLDMPVGVIKQILLRVADKSDSILRKEGEAPDFHFVIKSTNLKDGFKAKCKKSKADMELVIKELILYFKNEYGVDYNAETAKRMLLESFSAFFATILDTERGIIPGTIVKKERRRVAKFILLEKSKKSSIFDKIEDLTRGYIVYQAIYFFEKQPSMVSTIDLKNVTVYLDTPVLIDALEFGNAESTKTVNDMISLVKKLGGTVKVFTHIVEELQGILEKYCEVFPNTNTFKLDGLIRKYRSKIGIFAVSQSLSNVIGESFEVVDAPPLGIISDWETLNIEEAINRHYIRSLQKLPTNDTVVGKKRIENDTRSLMAIVKARNGNTSTTFNQCGAILLSDSRTARRTYASLRDGASSKEINFVYSVMDISCLLWLSSTRCSSELKEDLLLYSVSAAVETSDRVIRKMLDYTRDLEAVGSIRPETALAMRSNPRAKEIIADFCDNDPQLVTESTVIKTANELVIEQKANERAIPKMRVWKKITEFAISAIVGLVLLSLIVLPPILQITQTVTQTNAWTIIVPMMLGIIGAIYGFAGEKRVIQHIGVVSGNIVEDFIFDREIKKARKHAEYFTK